MLSPALKAGTQFLAISVWPGEHCRVTAEGTPESRLPRNAGDFGMAGKMLAKRPAYQFRLGEILLFINTLNYKVNVKYEICAVRLLSVQCDYRLQ